MPQMSPIHWTLLYSMFSLIFIVMIILNYYCFLYPPFHKIKKLTHKEINWKW